MHSIAHRQWHRAQSPSTVVSITVFISDTTVEWYLDNSQTRVVVGTKLGLNHPQPALWVEAAFIFTRAHSNIVLTSRGTYILLHMYQDKDICTTVIPVITFEKWGAAQLW